MIYGNRKKPLAKKPRRPRKVTTPRSKPQRNNSSIPRPKKY